MEVTATRLDLSWRGVRARELLLLGSCAGLLAVGRVVGNVVQGVPGHVAVLLLPPLFLAAGGVRRVGAPSMVALAGGLLAIPFVRPGVLALPSALVLGLVLDLVAFGWDRLGRLSWAVLAAVAANLAKWAVHAGLALALGRHGGSMRMAMPEVLLLYTVFGAAGGVLGAFALRGGRQVLGRGRR